MESEWKHTSLRDAGVTLIDCDHRTPPAADSGYPYVAIPQLKEGRLALADARRISPKHFAEWTRRAKPQHHDVILSRRCNPGETAYVPAGVECALGQNLVLLRADGTRLFPPFLRWLVRGTDWWQQVGTFINVGAVFDSLKCADIPNFKIPLPPLPEQKAIAGVLGALDDKIELNRRMNATLEAMARALFQSWFVDFDPVRAKAEGRPPAGLDEPTAALFPAQFQASELGEIPQGWTVQTIEGLCDLITSGGTPARMKKDYWEPATIPWFKTGELRDGPLIAAEENISEAGLANSSCKLWPAGTILFALYASPTVGRFGVLTKPGTANQAAAALVAKPSYGIPFLTGVLYEARARLQQVAVGAAQQNINQRVLKDHKVVAPPAEIARIYSRTVDPLFEQRIKLAEQSRTLATLRDTLLPKLLSGVLSVEELEHAEGNDTQ